MLNSKQKRFCKEYVIDNNATQAAIRAGYSKKTANEQGARLLVNVSIKEEIKKLQKKTSDKLDITNEMITKEFAKIAFSSFRHLHNTWIERKEFEQLTKDNPDILDCVQEIDTKIQKKIFNEYNDNSGKFEKVPYEIEFVKLKLYSKTDALKELGKHIGYYAEDNKQKQDINIPLDNMSYDQLYELKYGRKPN